MMMMMMITITVTLRTETDLVSDTTRTLNCPLYIQA